MKRSVWGSPALPMALRNMDNPSAAKMPPRINQSHIAVLGVKRAMICPLAESILRVLRCAVNRRAGQDHLLTFNWFGSRCHTSSDELATLAGSFVWQ